MSQLVYYICRERIVNGQDSNGQLVIRCRTGTHSLELIQTIRQGSAHSLRGDMGFRGFYSWRPSVLFAVELGSLFRFSGRLTR